MRILTFKELVPLAISTVALNSSPVVQTFKYNAINTNAIQISNTDTLDHLNLAQTSDYSGLIVRYKFNDHLKKWQDKTQFVSSPNQIVQDIDFREIVSLGELAVPLIMEEIENRPGYLVWALNIIFGTKISKNPNLTIAEASKLWLKFLKA